MRHGGCPVCSPAHAGCRLGSTGCGIRQLESSVAVWVCRIAISSRPPSSPTTRSTQRPSTGPSPYSSSPSSTKNSVAAARSSTTMPTCSIRWIVMCSMVRIPGSSHGVVRRLKRPDLVLISTMLVRHPRPASRSVVARSPVGAAMRRVFEAAPRHVDHQAVRSGSASERPIRREAQGSGTARFGRVRQRDRLRRRVRTLVRHEQPIRGCA
jgi:hypothetical protein